MLYHWYELGHAAVKPARVAADSCRLFFNNPFNPLTHTPVGRHAAAACEVFERTTRRYHKRQFGLRTTRVDGAEVSVAERVVWQRPFCRLLRFERNLPPERAVKDPKLLLVAPMSGHFATLLRGTVETFLPDHDVYVTDWQDAREVPLSSGSFDLDDYITYMVEILRHFGGDVHVFAVCQPAVPVLAAVALMEADEEASVPHSMILAGGPVDTRINPTVVNRLAERRGTDWFRRNMITTVPWPSVGHGRRVYPGFLQRTGFMAMNLDRHWKAHKDLFLHLVRGDGDSAEKHREFYDEYLAVMDLTAEFYLQTVDTVFVRHALPKGEMRHYGRLIEPARIRRPALMTIEGEKDDITGPGQCRAAHELCSGIAEDRKLHYQCPDVGHYGIFNGSRFRSDIAPRVVQFVRTHDPRRVFVPSIPAIDRAEAVARANGHLHELSSLAFTFAPANDCAPDPMARKLRSQGVGCASDLDCAMHGFQIAPFRLWALASSLLIDGMMRLHTGRGAGARSSVASDSAP